MKEPRQSFTFFLKNTQTSCVRRPVSHLLGGSFSCLQLAAQADEQTNRGSYFVSFLHADKAGADRSWGLFGSS